MTETTLDQWDPFNFRIEGVFGFKPHIEKLIKEKRFKTALERINMIRDKYSDALEFGKISSNTTRFHHFKSYLTEQSEMRSKGITYPDGSTDKVIFELNQLKKRIQSLQKGQADHLTTPEKGIVLYFLMYYGSNKTKNEFKPTRDHLTLEKYLKALELSGSGKTVYNKGINPLITDSDRNDGRNTGKKRTPGVLTRKEFLRAIDFLKKVDSTACLTAQNEFDSFCAENANGGNNQSFFKTK